MFAALGAFLAFYFIAGTGRVSRITFIFMSVSFTAALCIAAMVWK